MTYIPHTDADREAMLKAIGVASLDDLFDAVPADLRFPTLDLPAGLSEMETAWELGGLASANAAANDFAIFLGAGAYNHSFRALSTIFCCVASFTPPTRPTSRS